MKKNVGKIDKVIRVVVGVGMIAYAAMTGTTWAYLGVIPLVTAAMGFCPLYLPFGIKTCKTENQGS